MQDVSNYFCPFSKLGSAEIQEVSRCAGLWPYLQSEMSEGDTGGMWEEALANLLEGGRPTHKLILHFARICSGCLRRLGPGNWVPSNQLDFTHRSMWGDTCCGESRQPDEEATASGAIIKGKGLSASNMCRRLRCTNFLCATEREMTQL